MKRILIYGDSNTWGYVPGTGERYSEEIRWPMVVQKELGDDYIIIENGISGRTTCFENGWGDAKNGRTGLSYALLSSYPLDGVAIMLGSNDLTLYDANYALRGMGELLRIIKNANSYYACESKIFPKELKILLISPPLFGKEIDDDPMSLYQGKYEESKKLGQYYKKLAETEQVYYLDAAEVAFASDVDHLHLTPESHIALGKAAAEKIKEMMK